MAPRDERDTRKGRIFLGFAALSGLLLAAAVVFSRDFIAASRLVVFPSIIACIVFLALYARNTGPK